MPAFHCTDNAAVTCIFPSTGTCSQWKFAPTGSAGTINVAKLIKTTSSRGQTTVTDLGDFNVSFEFFVAK